MLGNKKLKYLKSLHLRKYRQKYGNFIVEGVKLAEEIIKAGQSEIEFIGALPSWAKKNQSFLASLPSDIFTELNEKELNFISQLKTPNQVVIVLKRTNYEMDKKEVSHSVSLYLDQIRDPGNMGTILRIADWFGIHWVFCSEGCVEVENPKVVQSTMGAFLRVKTMETSLSSLKSDFPDLPILGMTLDGKSVYENAIPNPSIIVIGNESRGISTELKSILTHQIKIPRHPAGGAESLNAAVATGIICALVQR